ALAGAATSGSAPGSASNGAVCRRCASHATPSRPHAPWHRPTGIAASLPSAAPVRRRRRVNPPCGGTARRHCTAIRTPNRAQPQERTNYDSVQHPAGQPVGEDPPLHRLIFSILERRFDIRCTHFVDHMMLTQGIVVYICYFI